MSDTAAGLRRKIGAAADLQSVVRTMKALAASNIGQFERSVSALKDYARAVELALGLCLREAPPPELAADPKKGAGEGPVGAVVFGSDQGLVGQFNETVAEYASHHLAGLPGRSPVLAVGERVYGLLADAGLQPTGVFPVPGSVNTVTPLVGRILLDSETRLSRGEMAELHLFYNRPASARVYETVSLRLLPLDVTWYQGLTRLPWPTKQLPEILGSRRATLRALVGEHLFVSLFRACAESLSAENASRLAAMQRAEKNIGELLEDLNRRYHQMRQSGIDEELFDVVSGFEALAGAHRRASRRSG